MLTIKISCKLKASMRFTNGLSEKQQHFIPTSFDYRFTKHFIRSVGFSNNNTHFLEILQFSIAQFLKITLDYKALTIINLTI